jgi:negative regulator of flagellin synthesis FlgM
MSTEIGLLKNVQTAGTQERERVGRTAGEPATGPGARAAGRSSTDEVSLSSSALGLKEAERRLALDPGVDQARVDAIRDALSEGAYRPDPARIADGLLAQEQMLTAGGAR